MDAAPDIAGTARLMGDRARAVMLTCLLEGRALTATELARAARVTKQTASAHLTKLASGQLVLVERAGRHRYYRLAHHDVGRALEALMGVAHRLGARANGGPPDPGLRKARVCYDHLAGDLGVLVFDSLKRRELLAGHPGSLSVTRAGMDFCLRLGIEVAALETARRPVCLACLDWSARRYHLAGGLGAALLSRCFALGWARRPKGTRTVVFSSLGERALRARFPLPG